MKFSSILLFIAYIEFIQCNEFCEVIKPNGMFDGILSYYEPNEKQAIDLIYKNGKMLDIKVVNNESNGIEIQFQPKWSLVYNKTQQLFHQFIENDSIITCYIENKTEHICKVNDTVIFENDWDYGLKENMIAFNPTKDIRHQNIVFMEQKFNKRENIYERSYYLFNFPEKTINKMIDDLPFDKQIDKNLLLTGIIAHQSKGHIILFYEEMSHKFCYLEENITSNTCESKNLKTYLTECTFETTTKPTESMTTFSPNIEKTITESYTTISKKLETTVRPKTPKLRTTSTKRLDNLTNVWTTASDKTYTSGKAVGSKSNSILLFLIICFTIVLIIITASFIALFYRKQKKQEYCEKSEKSTTNLDNSVRSKSNNEIANSFGKMDSKLNVTLNINEI